jgi:hypothetical protein
VHSTRKVYQLLTHGRWFSPGTPASSTTKTGRHDLAEILPDLIQWMKIYSSAIKFNTMYEDLFLHYQVFV